MSTQSFTPLQGPVTSPSASMDLPPAPLEVADTVVSNDPRLRCGWGPFRPSVLQRFRSAKWALFWLCWAGALQGMLVNGFVNVVITTIERRFGLRSTESGLIAGGYDIASFLCLVPVTYLGGRSSASKPRWLGLGVLILGLGSACFALPHFLIGPYRGSVDTSTVCSRVTNSSENTSPCSSESTHSPEGGVAWLFLIGQLLHGAGAAPLFTLGVTYIDENVSKKMSSVYLGIYYTMAILGPAVGYVLGGQLLQIYTDILTIDPATLGLTPHSNVWIGAWWIGFIVAAVLCGLVAVPLLAFPPSLPGAEALQKERVSEAHDGDGSQSEAFGRVRELPKALMTLMKNPTFFFLNLAGASEGLIIAGFAAFLPKLIENQFSVTASWAALLMGVITVPAGGGGTFLGGYLVKRLDLTCAGIIKLCLVATIAAVASTMCFFLSCPNLSFAGVTVAYQTAYERNNTKNFPLRLDSQCNSRCSCSRARFDPICGADNTMYFSPCHAGCTSETTLQDSKVYSKCACITDYATNSTESRLTPKGYEAINLMCESTCSHLPLFIVLAFFVMFFTFLATMPALSATLRCVRDEQRSFALGIQWIKVRLLGTIPAPMIFGALIDETCILWQQSCSGQGACLVYDNKYISRYMLGLAFIGKACSLLFFFGAWWFYIPPGKNKMSQTENTQTQNTDDTPARRTLNGHINHASEIERF